MRKRDEKEKKTLQQQPKTEIIECTLKKQILFSDFFFRDRTYCAWRLVSSGHGIFGASIATQSYSYLYVRLTWHGIGTKTKDSLKIFKADVVDFFSFAFGKRKVIRNTERKRDRIQDDVPFDEEDKAILHIRMFLLCTPANGKATIVSPCFVVLVPLLLLLWLCHAQSMCCLSAMCPSTWHLDLGLCWTKRSVHIFFLLLFLCSSSSGLGCMLPCHRPIAHACVRAFDLRCVWWTLFVTCICFGLASERKLVAACLAHITFGSFGLCIRVLFCQRWKHPALRLAFISLSRFSCAVVSSYFFGTWLLLIVKKLSTWAHMDNCFPSFWYIFFCFIFLSLSVSRDFRRGLLWLGTNEIYQVCQQALIL